MADPQPGRYPGSFSRRAFRGTMTPTSALIAHIEEVHVAEPQQCSRCFAAIQAEPHIMAGRIFCCASCSVGSACVHQGIRRSANVRRYDTMFDRFQQSASRSSPYEREVPHR